MNLLSVQAAGAFWTVFLFAMCFFFVHLFRLAHMGYHAGRRFQKEEEKEPEESTEAKHAEPVYYIVEKKKKRTKASYSEPKRIKFEK